MSPFASWARSFGRFLHSLARSAGQTVAAWSWQRWLAVVFAVLALLTALVCADIPDMVALRRWAEHLGPWFVIAFTAAYVFFTQFPLPRTLWTVAAGVFFGPWLGLGIALVALTFSAILSLLIVRRLLGSWIRPHLAHPAVLSINARLERRGWLAVASLRMVAGVPFSLLNYVVALTPIPLAQFTLATLLGSIPTTAIGVFFGDTLTTGFSPGVVAALAVFALIGAGGLYADIRLPARP